MAYRQYISPTPGEFPLIASTPWNERANAAPTIEDFQKVKETGFNSGLLSVSLSKIADIRFAAKVADLKLILGIGQIGMTKEDMIAFVRTATGSKDASNPKWLNDASDSDIITAWSFWGYPIASEFEELTKSESAYDVLYNWDTARNIHINLIGEPNTAIIAPQKNYQEYVDEYIRKFGPMVLSYNHYPFHVTPEGVANDSFSQFYEDLIIFSRKYKETGIPFWNYVQCACVKRASNGSILYSKATEWTLRFQIFNSLAFCVQGLVFWTYGRRPSDANDNFVSALLDDFGNLTEAGEAVKRINKEVRCLTDIFLGAVPQGYYTTGQSDTESGISSMGTPSLPDNDFPFRVQAAGGAGAVVTTFSNKDKRFPFKQRQYMMIVSRDMEIAQTATVEFKSSLCAGISIKAYSIIPDLQNEDGRFIKREVPADKDMDLILPRSGYLLFEYEAVSAL